MKTNRFDQEIIPRSVPRNFDQNESIKSQIRKMGPICKNRKKVFDFDLDKQSDGNDCLWLSSDGPSPSLFFKDYKLSSSLHISVDKWLVSWLSILADSYLHLEKGNFTRLYPDAARKGSDSNSIVRSSESKFSDDLSSFDNCPMPQISDFDRMSLLVSLVNLECEDSKLISYTEPDIDDHLPPDFPSPSCKSTSGSSDLNCNLTSEFVDLENFNIDEPLFWPSELGSEWNPAETWKSLSISPRKYTINLGIPQETSSISVESNLNLKIDHGRREFGSGSAAASKILERKQRSKTNSSKKVKPANGTSTTTPSRLRKSTKNSAKVVPLEMEDKRNDRILSDPKPDYADRDLLKDYIISNEEIPIEKLVGLGEFDGREGLDEPEYVEDIFLLDDS